MQSSTSSQSKVHSSIYQQIAPRLKNRAARLRNRAIDTYCSLRKTFWKDLSPRARIDIRNPHLNLAVNQAALTFWTAVASRNSAFAPVYRRDAGAATLPMSHGASVAGQWATPVGASHPARDPATTAPGIPVSSVAALGRSGSVAEMIANARRFGVARLEDVLPDRQFKLASKDFELAMECSPRYGSGGVRFHDMKPTTQFREIFEEIILKVTQDLFGIGFAPPKDRFIYVQRIELNGLDRGDSNTILHIDRFVPAIKLFYYPHAIQSVQMSPFSFVPESHFINEAYLDAVREFYQTPNGTRPMAIRNLTQNQEIPALVEGNSLILAYTNGLHRRIPFADDAPQGSFREAACFMFYNLYTRSTLLRKALLP